MKLNVAGLIVEIEPKYEMLASRAAPYEYFGDRKPDIEFSGISQKYYEDRQRENPALTIAECEYLWSGFFFYEKLLGFDGIMLHSSCVVYDGKAYLFSADSGTGKSTHTHLWLEYLPGAYILNDDKPALRFVDGKLFAFGTPWSGKNDESKNTGVEVAGIAFLNRGENRISRITPQEALPLFFAQTVKSYYKDYGTLMLDALDKVLSSVPMYKLFCDMSREAVMTSYNAMKG